MEIQNRSFYIKRPVKNFHSLYKVTVRQEVFWGAAVQYGDCRQEECVYISKQKCCLLMFHPKERRNV